MYNLEEKLTVEIELGRYNQNYCNNLQTLHEKKFIIVAANPRLTEKVYPAAFPFVVGVSLEENTEGFNLGFSSKGDMNIIVDESETEVMWRNNYVISARADSFSTARVSAILSLVIAKTKPRLKAFHKAWNILNENLVRLRTCKNESPFEKEPLH